MPLVWDVPMSELKSTIFNLYCDGASRGNPGPASTGIAVYDSEGNSLLEHGTFLGTMTNNEAEYNSLLEGVNLTIAYCRKKNYADPYINIFMDSELVVKQILGAYKVKNERLKPIYLNVKKSLEGIAYSIQHIPREKNKKADEMANKAIDEYMKK